MGTIGAEWKMSVAQDTLIEKVNNTIRENESRVERHTQKNNEKLLDQLENRVQELTTENENLKEDIKRLRKNIRELQNDSQEKDEEIVRASIIVSDMKEGRKQYLSNLKKCHRDHLAEKIEHKKLFEDLTDSYEKQLLKSAEDNKSLGRKLHRLEADISILHEVIKSFQQKAQKNQIMEKSQDDKPSTKIDALHNENHINSMKVVEIPKLGLLESKHLSPSLTTRQMLSVESLESETDYELAYPKLLIDSDGGQIQVIHRVSKESTCSPETSRKIICRLVCSWFQTELNFIKILTNYFLEAVKYMTPFWRNFFNIGKRHCSDFSNAQWAFLYTKFTLIVTKIFVVLLPHLGYLFRYGLFKKDPFSDSGEPLQEHELSRDSSSQFSDEMDEQAIAQIRSPTLYWDSDNSENETEREKESSLSKPVIELPNTFPEFAESCENHRDATISAIMQMINDILPLSFLVSCWENFQAWNIFSKDKRLAYWHLFNLSDKPEVLPTMFEILAHFSLYAFFYTYFTDEHGQADHICLYYSKSNHGYSHGWTRQLPISEVSAAKLDELIFQAVKLAGVEAKSFPLPG